MTPFSLRVLPSRPSFSRVSFSPCRAGFLHGAGHRHGVAGRPLEYFTGDYDIWMQEDGKVLDLERFNNSKHAKPLPGGDHQLCTCFMYIRPTPASKKLIYAWSQDLRNEGSKKSFENLKT